MLTYWVNWLSVFMPIGIMLTFVRLSAIMLSVIILIYVLFEGHDNSKLLSNGEKNCGGCSNLSQQIFSVFSKTFLTFLKF
jgi:hypothetical protein